MMPRATLLLAVIATLAAGDTARADCSLPDFELLWTYPEDGDDDVPINAQLWVLTSTWGSSATTITLNGESLTGEPQSFGGQVIDPGELEPDADYTLELRFAAGSSSGGEEQVITIDFHTTSDAAPAASAPVTVGDSRQPGYGGHTCADVVSAQDCFDTGQDTLLTVVTQDDDALGYVIQLEPSGSSAVWPARCGGPSLFSDGDFLVHRCVLVRKIGPGGLLSEATRYCAQGEESDAGVPEPTVDAGAPSGGSGGGGASTVDAGVVSPLDSGTRDSGTNGMSTIPPDSGGADGGGPPDEAAPASKKDDGGCSIARPASTADPDAFTWLLGALAIALFRRARAA